MFSELKFRRILDRLNFGPDVAEQDYLTLGEVVRLAFPAESPLAKAYASLSGRYEDARTEGDPGKVLKGLRKELSALAGSAKELMHSDPTHAKEASERDRSEALQIVNQAYHESSLFSFTKWVLIISLALLGLGSLSFAGFSFYAGDRLQKAQKELDTKLAGISTLISKAESEGLKFESQRQQLQDKQSAVLGDMDKRIGENAARIQNLFEVEVSTIKQELTRQKAAATIFIEEQKESLAKAIKTTLEEAASEVTTKIKEGLKAISDSAVAGGQRVDSEAESTRRTIAQKSGEFTTLVSDARNYVDDEKKKLNTNVEVAMAEAKAKVDGAVTQHIATMTTFAENGARKIDDELQARLRTLSQASDAETKSLNSLSERKKFDLDAALQRNITSLNETLTVKTTDLNARTADGAKRIEAIVADAAAQEQRFIVAINERLSTWDRKLRSEQQRFEDLSNALRDAQGRQDRLQAQLGAVETNSSAALEIAAKLSADTSSGQLSLIGAVLEKAAGIVILSLVLGLVTLALSISILWLLWRRKILRFKSRRIPEVR